MSKRIDFVWLEGALELPVARRLFAETSLNVDQALFRIAGGNAPFWSRIPDRNASAKAGLVVVAIGDLEQEPCAGQLIKKHLPRGCEQGFVLRLAVRMMESWLLADIDRMASFLGASPAKLPDSPDNLRHPKQELIRLARQYSSRALRADLVPEPDHTGVVGKGYRSRMEEFIQKRWRPRVAARHSESLRRAIEALERLGSS